MSQPVESSEYDLWAKLGTTPLPAGSVDDYVAARSVALFTDPDFVFAWKALRDPNYHALYERTGSVTALTQAGFFADTLQFSDEFLLNFDPRLLCTPTDKLSVKPDSDLLSDEVQLVLVTTGGFAPPHPGHLNAMDSAKAFFESRGTHVAGGYLSPSHDRYVSLKDPEHPTPLAPERIVLCQNAAAEYSWLDVDPWESLYLPTDVNFTDVRRHLEHYLRFHVADSIRVVYVFGADNADFTYAFVNGDLGICVERTGAEQQFQKTANQVPSVAHITPRHGASSHNSSALRKQASPRKARPATNLVYAYRQDLKQATRAWDLPDADVEDFNTRIQAVIQGSLPHDATLISVDVDTQQELLAKNLPSSAMLNLDVYAPTSPTSFPLGISRLFEISSAQVYAPRLVPRPGHPSLADQLSAVPPGAYTFVDDDIASGETLSLVRDLVSEAVDITGQYSLLHAYLEDAAPESQVYDVVDARDFLLGATNGGLLVKGPKALVSRAVYAYPYVNLCTRAKVAPLSCFSASLAIWQANQQLFIRHPSLLLSDADSSCQALYRYLGFSDKTSLLDIAGWHATLLERLV